MKKFGTIVLVLNIIVIGLIAFNQFGIIQSQDPEISSSDTTIVINHYYDTTIKEVIVKNYQNPVQVLSYTPEECDTCKDPFNYCDSIRIYHPEGGNDSLKIYNKAVIQGRLLSFDQSYQIMFPTEQKTVTITNEIIKSKAGFYIGADLLFYGDLGTDFPNSLKLHPGISFQYNSKSSTNYRLIIYNKGFNCGISKKISFRKK